MATRKIVEIGDPKLKTVCKPVTKFDLRLRLLMKDMTQTMYKANGVGLAAPQVGILKRVIVVDVGDGLYEVANPRIVLEEGSQTGAEGCLSVPGRRGEVTRPNHIRVEGQDFRGEPISIEAEGFLARAFCHEVDHLNGILYVEKMNREIFQDDPEYPINKE